MKNTKIYTLPQNYIERQRIIKALQYPPYELVMWYYHTPDEGGKEYLYGVYLKADDALCVYFYDIETLQMKGRGYNPEKPPEEQFIFDTNDIYRWLRRKHDITDLFGFALGVQPRPPNIESKIIQFPAIRAKRRKQRGTA